MSIPSSPDRVAQVVIAGGGFAALEAALALRALAADRVRLKLVCPDSTFRYRPAATVEAFDETPPRTHDLRSIAGDLRATYYQAQLESVAPAKRYVRLGSGTRLPYDALVLAIGARSTAGIPGALTFRDQRDVSLFRDLLHELEAGSVASVAFAVPSRSAWPLPLYELALLCAARAEELGRDAEISLVTPEREPLAMFGPRVSQRVAELLEDRGVRFLARSIPAVAWRDGSLTLQFDGAVKADRVVTAPQLRAPRIPGIPASWWGFVPTDMFGRVEGLEDVYAAGDMTTFPVKQGGVAAQQADRIANAIVASLGAAPPGIRSRFLLQARLLGGEHPLFMRTELDWRGNPTTATAVHGDHTEAHAGTKVFGRYLTPYLDMRQRAGDHARAAAPA